MRVFTKLVTAVRGSAREAAEAVVDANAIRIFGQEIYDCEAAIQQAKCDLSRVVAEKLRLQRDIEAVEAVITRRENEAAKAVTAGEDALAREVAVRIADEERVLLDQRDKLRQLDAYQARLEKTLRSASARVQDYQRELRMVQATASAQTASHRVAGSTHTIVTRTADMQSSLERIKQTQQAMADQMDALAQVERAVAGRDLDEHLRTAGCSQNGDPAATVLERIKAIANRSPAIGD